MRFVLVDFGLGRCVQQMRINSKQSGRREHALSRMHEHMYNKSREGEREREREREQNRERERDGLLLLFPPTSCKHIIGLEHLTYCSQLGFTTPFGGPFFCV